MSKPDPTVEAIAFIQELWARDMLPDIRTFKIDDFSPRQQQVLDLIKTGVKETGKPPKQTEMAAALGVSSGRIFQLVGGLRRKKGLGPYDDLALLLDDGPESPNGYYVKQLFSAGEQAKHRERLWKEGKIRKPYAHYARFGGTTEER